MKTLNLQPDATNILKYARVMFNEGHVAQAHNLLQEGWNITSFADREAVLQGKKVLEEVVKETK